jgi:fucose permease
MESYYNVSYTVISLIFIVSFVGYVGAALGNNIIHFHLGQRGIAFLGPISRMVGYILICLHLPFPALPPFMLFAGFANGIEDSAWNAWIGNMESANELLGFLHGAYGLGGTLGPLISTAMVAKADLPWWYFFYLMIGMTALEIGFATTAFWGATPAEYRKSHTGAADGVRTTTRTVLRNPIPWLVAMFLFGYVGAEVSLGGWITTFMLKVRHAEAFDAGLTVTFFWLGLTVGRIILGFVTGRIGEKLAITIYLLISIGLQLMYCE